MIYIIYKIIEQYHLIIDPSSTVRASFVDEGGLVPGFLRKLQGYFKELCQGPLSWFQHGLGMPPVH